MPKIIVKMYLEGKMNYIKKVAGLLNVEVGEHFAIHFKKEKRQIRNFFLNEEKGLMVKTGGS